MVAFAEELMFEAPKPKMSEDEMRDMAWKMAYEAYLARRERKIAAGDPMAQSEPWAQWEYELIMPNDHEGYLKALKEVKAKYGTN